MREDDRYVSASFLREKNRRQRTIHLRGISPHVGIGKNA
jgi:hypothetical protein